MSEIELGSAKVGYDDFRASHTAEDFLALPTITISDPVFQKAAVTCAGSTDFLVARFSAGNGFRPRRLADEIQSLRSFLTSPIDDAGRGVTLLVYESGYYHKGEDLARRLAHGLLRDQSKPRSLEDAIALLKESTKIEYGQLNPHANDLINLINGMLDWRTGQLLPHSPKHLSTVRINARYDPTAKSAIVDKFLADIFPEDAMLLAQELVGYLLVATIKWQKAFMLVGLGANGKSTFLFLVTSLLGEENVSNVSLQDFGENRFKVAELLGKLANIYADLPSKAVEQSDMFKNIVTGDAITAERKFGHPFKFKAYARLLFSANELPRTKDRTAAFFRRWFVIPFLKIFDEHHVKPDPDILQKLTTDEAKSALLNHALIGLQRLDAQNGFSKCPSVIKATTDYRIHCDNIFEFIQEKLERNSNGCLPKQDVSAEYVKWCGESGIQHPATKQEFNKAIAEHLGAKEGREILSDGGKGKRRAWQGIAWKDETFAADDQPDHGEPEIPGLSYPSTNGVEHSENGYSGPGFSGPTRSADSKNDPQPVSNETSGDADAAPIQAEFDLPEAEGAI
jgi:putative DNA primase/helicase